MDGGLKEADFAQPSGLATMASIFTLPTPRSRAFARSLAQGTPPSRPSLGSASLHSPTSMGKATRSGCSTALALRTATASSTSRIPTTTKIKTCDPATKTVKTFVGNTTHGDTDDPPRFYQPGGLSVSGDTLYVADTNNGVIRTVDLEHKTVKTLEIEGLSPPARPRAVPTFPNALTIEVAGTRVKPAKEITLDVTLPLPEGVKFNDGEAISYLVEVQGKDSVLGAEAAEIRHVKPPAAKFAVKILEKDAKTGARCRSSCRSPPPATRTRILPEQGFVFNVARACADGVARVPVPRPQGRSGWDPPPAAAKKMRISRV